MNPVVLLIPTCFAVAWLTLGRHIRLASTLTAMLACWTHVLFFYPDDAWIVAYYWFDLVIMIIVKDYLLMVHHLVVLYGLYQDVSHPDYHSIHMLLYVIKIGDLFLHIPYIIEQFKWNYPKTFTAFRIFNLASWTVCRLWFTWVTPFVSWDHLLIKVFFIPLNLWWMNKLFHRRHLRL